MSIVYSRAVHAAHNYYGGAPLWDLEQWDAVQERDEPRPSDVPEDASRHIGYVDTEGRQHVVYVRKAPPSEKRCSRCRHEVQP